MSELFDGWSLAGYEPLAALCLLITVAGFATVVWGVVQTRFHD